MKIEFGGGHNPQKKEYVQVDIRKINDHTVVCNAWDIADHVPKDSVTEIYSRHFFEHLTMNQAILTLKAWKAVCTTGARIELICPNMKKHIWQWQNWNTLTEKEKDHCRAGFWGWQKEADTDSWDLHKSGYDFEKLSELVYAHGFRNIRKIINDDVKQNHLWVEFFK